MNDTSARMIERLEESVLFVLFVFALATVFLASFLIYVIFSGRFKLRKHSFFIVCAEGYIFNITSLLSLNVGKTFAALGWMPQLVTQTETTARMLHFAIFFSRCGELHTTVFSALNRMMAILLPSKYEQIWSGSAIIALVIYQVVISIAVGVLGAMHKASWIPGDGRGFYPQFQQSETGKLVFGGLLTFSIIFIVFISCSYTAAYVKLHALPRSINDVKNRVRSERSLTYVAIITCCVEVLYYSAFAYIFLITKHAEDDPRTFHFVLAIQGNLASGVHPYLLFLFSGVARRVVWRCLCDLFNYTRRSNGESTTEIDSNFSL